LNKIYALIVLYEPIEMKTESKLYILETLEFERKVAIYFELKYLSEPKEFNFVL
jgi:hypothetical protein